MDELSRRLRKSAEIFSKLKDESFNKTSRDENFPLPTGFDRKYFDNVSFAAMSILSLGRERIVEIEGKSIVKE